MIGALLLSVSLGLVTGLAAAQAATTPDNLCTLCHPDVRVTFQKSIHRIESITCVSCHGGDPKASTVEGAHRGFRGRIERKDIPAFCATCHSDVNAMRPYNLPTDQHALFQTSGHGRGLARGDDRVAVCTDCHGAHDILAPDNPASPTHWQNIPATCARCHSDAALAARYGWTSDPLVAWQSSVHGAAVREQGNHSAPVCSRCHGAHGAAPPGFGDIEKVCGQCHVTSRAHFLEGPHHAAMTEAGLGECATCHDHHAVARTEVADLDRVCLDCHAEGSEEVLLASRMKTLFDATREDLHEARRLVQRAAEIPVHVEDFEARLTEAETVLMESLPAMHALEIGRIEALADRARSIAHQVQSEASGKLGGKFWRRIGLIVFWFYLLMTLAVLVRLRARAARDARP